MADHKCYSIVLNIRLKFMRKVYLNVESVKGFLESWMMGFLWIPDQVGNDDEERFLSHCIPSK